MSDLQRSNQFPEDEIKPRPTFFLISEAVSLRYIRPNKEKRHSQLPFHDDFKGKSHSLTWKSIENK